MNTLPTWFIPIAVSALTLGIYDLCKKHAVRDNAVMPVLFWATLCGSLFFIAAVVASGQLAAYASCTYVQWGLIFSKSLLVSASWTCVYYALRDLPISIATAVRATAPLWTFIGSIFLFNEIPTFYQGIAMLAIFAGYCIFSVIGRLEGFSIRRHRGMHLIFLGTLLGASSALYDKYLLGTLAIPRQAVQFWFSVDLLFILGGAYWIRRWFSGRQHQFHWRWSIPATGISLIISDYLYFYAVSVPEAHISILSLIRRCSCAVTFAAGVYYFHETNILRKAAALALILAGVAVLALA